MPPHNEFTFNNPTDCVCTSATDDSNVTSISWKPVRTLCDNDHDYDQPSFLVISLLSSCRLQEVLPKIKFRVVIKYDAIK